MNMKKTYMQPSTVEVRIATIEMIAVSGEPKPTFSPNEETADKESRRSFSLWDDEEEE